MSSSGAPVPADFRYAMFPATNDVAVFDRPDGKAVGTLTRAMVNVESEMRAGGWVEMVDPGGSTWSRFEDLRFRAPAGLSTDYVGAFEKVYQRRDPADFRAASLRFEESQGGAATVTLHLGQDDGWQEYVYQVADGDVTPIAVYRVHGASTGLIEAMRFVGAAFVAMVAAAVGCGVLVITNVRRRAVR